MVSSYFVIFFLAAPLFVREFHLAEHLFNSVATSLICTMMTLTFYWSVVGLAKLSGGDW